MYLIQLCNEYYSNHIDHSNVTERGKNIILALAIKVPIAPNWKGPCLQNKSKPHSYHLKIW